MRHFNYTKGALIRLSSWIPSVSVMRFTVQMSKLNGLGKTHQKRICSRTENFARPFTTKKIFWDNSDIKWIKVPSINSIVTEYLTFKLSRYFLWRIKINYRRFLGRFSTNLMTLLFIQIHFETNIFLKIRPAKEPIRMQDSLPCPLKKK